MEPISIIIALGTLIAGIVGGKFIFAKNTQKQIDEILDKISQSGYDCLTKEEKEFLFKAGK